MISTGHGIAVRNELLPRICGRTDERQRRNSMLEPISESITQPQATQCDGLRSPVENLDEVISKRRTRVSATTEDLADDDMR